LILGEWDDQDHKLAIANGLPITGKNQKFGIVL